MKNGERLLTFPDMRRAAAVMVYGGMVAAVFTIVYGYTNFRASGLPEAALHGFYTEWEQTLPLVEWMVFPYLSLNLLLLVSILVIRETRVIRDFCLAMSAAAVMAGVVFYFFPGKLGFARAVGEGHLPIFDRIYAIDFPHNLFPSLHVTYSTLAVWAMRSQVKSRGFRAFLWFWLALISVSVVLTHQHHLFDVLTGAVLAAALIPVFLPEGGRG